MAISRMQQPRQMYQEGGIMPRLNQLGSGVSSAEQMLQGINQRLESAESSLGEGGGGTLANISNANFNTSTGGLIPGQRSLFTEITDAQDKTMGIPNGPGLKNIYGEPATPGAYPAVGKPYVPPATDRMDFINRDQIGNGFYTSNAGLGSPLAPMSQAMRNMAADGGMMGRQNYGLGSLVKSVTKGVKSAVKGITGAVKDNPLLAVAALNFAPMLIPGGASTFIGGSKAMFPGVTSLFAKKAGEKTLGDVAKVFAGGSVLGGLLSQAEAEGDPEGITRDVGALKLKLADAYRNQRTFADAEDEEAAIARQVELDTAEYTKDMARGYAQGGRIGYALGTPEQNAMKASGIMGLPMNTNPAGVKELDLRETGGFIPPVGVKEKADDIPAMLSNNEFVFTADAVRGMGDGNVNKGAQRLYDQMKMLEKGGRV